MRKKLTVTHSSSGSSVTGKRRHDNVTEASLKRVYRAGRVRWTGATSDGHAVDTVTKRGWWGRR